MGENLDTWRAAAMLLRRHGTAAEREAERHRRHCERHGMEPGVRFWAAVIAAIGRLRDAAPEARRH